MLSKVYRVGFLPNGRLFPTKRADGSLLNGLKCPTKRAVRRTGHDSAQSWPRLLLKRAAWQLLAVERANCASTTGDVRGFPEGCSVSYQTGSSSSLSLLDSP